MAARQTRTLTQTTLAGLGFGVGLTSTTLTWMSAIDTGAALGLIVIMSAWYGLLGLLLHLSRHSRCWPVLAAGSWLVVEYAAARLPFGGFGWLRLAYTQLESPLSGLLPLVGVAGLSFATALTGTMAARVLELRPRRGIRFAAASVVLLLASAALGNVIQPAPATGSATVGWVQGGAPGGGVYGLGPPRTITTNQTRTTVDLAAAIASGRYPTPDFVAWPENSTDLDPGTDRQTGHLVRSAATTIQRPILVGAILDGPGPDQRQTASQWTEPSGKVGPTYVKRSIVPFGEWIPFRDVLLPLVPQLRYVGRQSVPGVEPGLLQVALADGTPLRLGVLACFDVAFDPVVYALAPAELIVVQSSNAMYQGTNQIEQQFAITRARAIELRREILVVTTSGVSGLIDPWGQVLSRATGPDAAFGVERIPLRTGATPATWLALPLERTLVAVTGAWLLGVACLTRLGHPRSAGRAFQQQPGPAERRVTLAQVRGTTP